jgi:4-hydroxy-tetrahydrodipicolinate synthase
VIAGRGSLILASLSYGGAGAIAATANVVPKLVVGIYARAFVRGDIKKS